MQQLFFLENAITEFDIVKQLCKDDSLLKEVIPLIGQRLKLKHWLQHYENNIENGLDGSILRLLPPSSSDVLSDSDLIASENASSTVYIVNPVAPTLEIDDV